jgi:hypothetical protein
MKDLIHVNPRTKIRNFTVQRKNQIAMVGKKVVQAFTSPAA